MATRMQQRRGTAADWAAQNPVLAAGEIGFETDTKVLKMGDGETPWSQLTLPYLTTSGGILTGHLSVIAPTANAHAARKQDVDARVAKSGDTMTGHLSLVTPTANAHAARKQDVDARVAKSGDTMTDMLLVDNPNHGRHLRAKRGENEISISVGGSTGSSVDLALNGTFALRARTGPQVTTIHSPLHVEGPITSDGNPRVFVQSTAPASSNIGDLWGW